MTSALLPCPSCGAECFGAEDVDGVEAAADFEFGGEQATRDLPGKRCPDCGEVFAL